MIGFITRWWTARRERKRRIEEADRELFEKVQLVEIAEAAIKYTKALRRASTDASWEQGWLTVPKLHRELFEKVDTFERWKGMRRGGGLLPPPKCFSQASTIVVHPMIDAPPQD